MGLSNYHRLKTNDSHKGMTVRDHRRLAVYARGHDRASKDCAGDAGGGL